MDAVKIDLTQFECPICREVLSTPIHQCSQSHSMCDGCHKKMPVKNCPTCLQPVNLRNRWAESALEAVLDVACRNMGEGCKERLSLSVKRDHELNKCLFRDLTCFHKTCLFQGNSKALAEHLVNLHKYRLVETDQINYTSSPEDLAGEDLKASSNPDFVWQKNIYHCHGAYFILRVAYYGGACSDVRVSLITIGSKAHSYSVAASGSGMKFNYEGPAYPLRRNPLTVGEAVGACLTIKLHPAFYLANGNWKAAGEVIDSKLLTMTVTGEIKPVDM